MRMVYDVITSVEAHFSVFIPPRPPDWSNLQYISAPMCSKAIPETLVGCFDVLKWFNICVQLKSP